MSVIDISISFQVAILSIATPLLLQVILNLDQKYNSQYIIKLFKKESELIVFVFCLFASLFLTGFYVYFNSFIKDIYNVPLFIVNVVSVGIPILTSFLIVALLFFIRKILIYYEPNRFLKFSLEKGVDKDEDLFYAFSDVFYYSIREKNDSLIKEIKDEIALLFQKHSKKSSNSLIKYPENYYEFVERSVSELSIINNRWLKFLEYKTAGVDWYLNSHKKGIHEESYTSFWKILIIALESNRDDLANHMWHNLHSYANFDLRELHYDYDFKNLDQGPINAKEVDLRKKHRNRLFEFANALGGLALYLKKYELINEMFTYTNQEPPKYELLPDTIDDIFDIYFKFKDPHSFNFPDIRVRYYFPGKSGISGENIVKECICNYAALLLLRKYYMKPSENSLLPNIPVDQAEKRNWLNLLHDFRKKVAEVQENKNLLTALGFGNLDENNLLNTDEFFGQLEQKINEAFEREEREQDLSPEKINKFLLTTGRILTQGINQFSSVCNSNEINEDYERYITEDLPFVWQRSSFLENVDADHLNFDSVLADKQAQIIKDTVLNTFNLNNSTSYIIEIDSLFKAVDAVISNTSEEEVIIVNAGVYLGWYLNQVGVDGLTEHSYKEISIINLKHFTKLTGRSLYILRKSDLPYFNHLGPEEKLKEKFSLKRVGDNVNYQLYSSIIDLKGNDDLQEELKDVRNDLDKFVYAYIFSRVDIRWKNDIDLIELRQYSEFRGDTNLAPIEDIEEIF